MWITVIAIICLITLVVTIAMMLSLNNRHQRTIDEMRAMQQRLSDEQMQRLDRQNGETLNRVVDPLRRQLDDLGRLVRETRDHDTAVNAALQGQIKQLVLMSRDLGDEARQLTQALKGDSKIQGDWGELQLTTMLEQGGLQPGIHFTAQLTRDKAGRTLRDEEGNLRRPDVVINLPGGHCLVVDSKVSLTAFAEYSSATDENQQAAAARSHLESVRRHIKELAAKRYPSLVDGALDQTLMFVPTEGALQLALRLDPALARQAAELHIAIVSPMHLWPVVQMAAQLWRQDAQDRNNLRIAEVGGRLYDKLAVFMANFDKVGDQISRTRTLWEDARSQLATGRGNALSTAESLREMGAKVSKRLPAPEEE